uniref:Uncharacterized protein n=1 Tax=Branchiostoma floridae TaxID=7739 RepID=C3ZIR6_BRAFL|eukprot:XP_002591590.1 hypothetical protein BRAFLDRAFT_108432 [Branchiostoma floridae]
MAGQNVQGRPPELGFADGTTTGRTEWDRRAWSQNPSRREQGDWETEETLFGQGASIVVSVTVEGKGPFEAPGNADERRTTEGQRHARTPPQPRRQPTRQETRGYERQRTLMLGRRFSACCRGLPCRTTPGTELEGTGSSGGNVKAATAVGGEGDINL